MAVKSLCSIPDCGKLSRKKGLCNSHYERQRLYGSPLAGGTKKGELLRYLMQVVFKHESDDCLVWPYAKIKTGYGRIKYDGKPRYVHRIVCERSHGPEPMSSMDVAHSCGNASCVNYRHLRWATRLDNMNDMITHGRTQRGERHVNSVLTEENVRWIRSMKGEMSAKDMADTLSLPRQTIQNILSGIRWAWLTD